MALPVLDGNQSATTLSSVVTGGEHIVAHSVVSLGSQAISDITSAFPATQTVAGTVTANLANVITINTNGSNYSQRVVSKSQLQFSVVAGAHDPLNYASDYTVLPLKITQESEGRNLAVDLRRNQQVGGNSDLSAIDIDNTVQGFPTAFVRTQVVGGTVTVGNSVTIGSLPAISGTVTVGNIDLVQIASAFKGNNVEGPDIGVQISWWDDDANESRLVRPSRPLPVGGTVTVGNSVTIGAGTAQIGSVTASISSFATSVTARLVDISGTAVSYAATGTAGSPSSDVISVQGVSGGTAVSVSISSVTIGAVPNGALTTRFGSVTTANTAQISSAVTLATRKYLLIQNVTTSSNVITVGIGFTPTTTQGIQLAAGAGITFESSYIPTGAVYVLSSVTASPFTILEA